MKLNIISAESVLYSGDVDSVTLPGAMGSFTVLHNHATLLSTLTEGTVAYRDIAGNELTTDIGGGIASVDNNIINVCVY